jgi:two-component system, chemotaxis family, protein-glutamate methylesterase/glutaminase
MKKIRVLIVDDSALVRQLLSEIVNAEPDMVAVGAAPDPYVAREMIRGLDPDVVTLDVEMPRMDGLTFLERLMRLRPTRVLMLSSLTERGSEATLQALELGAIDFVAKPKSSIAEGLRDYREMIADKIRAVARAQPKRLACGTPREAGRPVPARIGLASTEKLVFIGASTGGTEAIKEVLLGMPPDAPAILIVQHMPEGFTRSFAQRLDHLCQIRVKEAEHGERVMPGHAYVAPGHSHLLLGRSGANYVAELDQGAPVNRHRPSVEVLFRSAAHHAGRNAIGIILTGMGKDGAAGMLAMREAGAWNVAQDEASCVVFGMPKEAIAVGAVHEIVPLRDIADRTLARLTLAGPRAVRV